MADCSERESVSSSSASSQARDSPPSTDSSFEEENKGKKRKLSSSEESTSRCESPLPSITSDWNQRHLDIINVHPKFLVHIEPSEVIRMSYMKGIIMPAQKALEYVDWKANDIVAKEITRCMSSAIESMYLDYESVQDMPPEAPEEMMIHLRAWKKEYVKTLPRLQSEKFKDIEDFCLEIEQNGRKFADQLKYMLILKKDKKNSLEGKYQQLFQLFLMMFSFKVWGFANVDRQTLAVGEMKITSIPDFLVMEARSSLEVLIVGEVKRRYGKLDHQISPVKTRSTQSRESFIRHVSEDLVGQHAGELLSHIHLSIFGEKGIFGMIVQATEVSFTSLFPESGYMESLKEGHGMRKEATLNISKGCNILSRAGRENLLKPLLDLYFLQKMYNIKGKDCYTLGS